MLFDKSKFEQAYKDPKLYFIYKEIDKIKNIKILELGVRSGISTSLFLKLCEDNDGKLLSVDIDDCSHLYKNNRWHFIHSRDDDFEKINKKIIDIGGVDIIYIDSLHEPNHVKKIIFNYFKFLKKDGFIFVDDISWLPYAKSSYRENSWNYEMNIKTFRKILEIKFNNNDKIEVEFSFENSGTAKITKKSNIELKEPKKIVQIKPLKNFFKSIYKKIF